MPAWKDAERRVAKLLGGRRIPVTGIDRADRDVEAGMFYYQVKHRRCLPQWLWDWLGGIQANAQPAGKVGVLILSKPRQRAAESLVVLSLKDWQDLHGIR